MPAFAVEHDMTTKPVNVDRRKEPRLLCADLVTVHWLDEHGGRHESVANLEDVSHRGACLAMEMAIAPESEVRIDTGRGHYLGSIRYLTAFAGSYLMGVQFQPGCEWEQSRYHPAHLFDPQSLAAPGEAAAGAKEREPMPELCADDLQRLLRILRSDFAR